jgi:hypothetical protein
MHIVTLTPTQHHLLKVTSSNTYGRLQLRFIIKSLSTTIVQAFAMSILKRQCHKNTFKALRLPSPNNQDILHKKVV